MATKGKPQRRRASKAKAPIDPQLDPARPMLPPSQRAEAASEGVRVIAERVGMDAAQLAAEEAMRDEAGQRITVVALARRDGSVVTDLSLPGNRELYLRTLERCGRHQDACVALGLEPGGSANLRAADPMFDHQCRVAIGMFASRVRRALVRRAIHGWQEPIVGGKDRDQIVAYKPCFSERLLELLAKSLDKDLRNLDAKGAAAQANVQVNVGGGAAGGLTMDELRQLSPEARHKLRDVLAELTAKRSTSIDAVASEGAPAAWPTDAHRAKAAAHARGANE